MTRLRHVAALALALAACAPAGTGHLPADLEQRFQQEGILRRADDQVFRYTYYSRSTRGNRWEDRDASIVVTPQTIYIFKNEKKGLEITPRTRREVDIRRDADRLVIAAGSGQSRVSWSFRPPSDPEGWARDLRAVVDSAS